MRLLSLYKLNGLLANLGEVESMRTSMWEIERRSLRNDAVLSPLRWTGTWCKTPKPPRFTKSAQEPLNGGSFDSVSGVSDRRCMGDPARSTLPKMNSKGFHSGIGKPL